MKQHGTLEQLAERWGMTSRRAAQLLVEMGIPDKGRIDLGEATRAYIAWLRRDEPTRRAKRELVSWQRQRIEQELAREDRTLLQPGEVKALVEEAWVRLRQGHLSSVSTLYNTLHHRFGMAEPDFLVAMLECEQRINAELVHVREQLEELHGAALERMACELRNGLLHNKRTIRALEHALNEGAP